MDSVTETGGGVYPKRHDYGSERPWSRLAPLWILVIWLVPTGPLAAFQYNFTHYETSDGLPQVQVLAVHQGPEGYLWFGTYGGLSRYNGDSFRNYRTGDGLASNFITDLATGPDGTLWIGTAAGLCHRVNDSFQCLEHDALQSGRVNRLLATDDSVWVASEAGLFRIRGEQVVSHVPGVSDGNGEVSAVAVDGEGRLWAGTPSGLYVREDDAFRPVAMPETAGREVTALAWVPTGPRAGLWIGTSNGLYQDAGEGARPPADLPATLRQADIADIHNDDGQAWVASNRGLIRIGNDDIERLSLPQGLVTDITFQVQVDREGVLWVGHDNGVSKLVPGPFAGYTMSVGMIDNFVRTLNEDHRQRLWLGTRSGLQIVPRVDGEWRMDESRILTTEEGLPDDRIYSIDFAEPGEAFIATGGGLVRWREGNGVVGVYGQSEGLPSSRVISVFHDSRDRTWVGTPMGLAWIEGDTVAPVSEPELEGLYVYRMREDEAGRMWLATEQSGLVIHDPDGETRHLTAAEGVSDEALWDIAPDHDGAMWVGSNGDGLFRVSPEGDIRQYTEADGLPDNFVWQVLVDSRGQVWAYTNRGLSRFNGEEFRNYKERDGLLHLEGGATGAWESSDGSLWFASGGGLMRYDPAREYRNDVPPDVKLESVTAEGESVERGLELPYRPGNLEFQFSGLSFQDESAVRFRYRLIGLNSEWSEVHARRHMSYANLSGGDYAFEVMARNPHGVWSRQPARFEFSVRSPFWTTVWFWLLVAGVLSLMLWSGFRLRVRHMETTRRALEAEVDTRTRELADLTRKYERASVTDPMTGLFNRRFFMQQIRLDVAQARRSYQSGADTANRDLIFMMIDLDHFKSINDRYGHAVGDRILQQFADLIAAQLRESDYVVRWGGEEFLVIARQGEADSSDTIADRIVEAARQQTFMVDDEGTEVRCTCSIGIAQYPFLPRQADALSWEDVLDVADMAVYRAKATGRDGWVRIRGGADTKVDDNRAFMRAVKEETEACASAGKIQIDRRVDGRG